jgi:dihydrodipicolinate synthase/N-acetylneuraminate lyase
MKASSLHGVIPAVIVPMRQDYSIDFEAYRRYLEWIIPLGPVGLAVNVDTGEGPYLTPEERSEVIRVTKEVAAGRCFVVAGIGGPSTINAVANAQAARRDGADALLIFPTAAFLNDPLDPKIMYDYHQAIAEAADLPLIVFQLGPVFGGVNYPPHALAEVLRIPQIIGLKDASFDAERFVLTRDVIRQAGHPITLLTGNDNFLLESFLLGAQGGLLGYGAVGAGLLVEMHTAVKNKDFEAAAAMQDRVQGFCDYIYGRPIGDYRARCKVALVHMGLLTPEQTYVRPPYLSLWEQEQEQARQAVERAGLRASVAVA